MAALTLLPHLYSILGTVLGLWHYVVLGVEY
jgi:hypothetical protein